MISKKFRYYIFFLLLISGCIYKFDPPSEGYDNLLVVEALLTDGEETFEVKLSRSIPINTGGVLPEENAQVSVSDNIGNMYYLYEVNDGIYLSDLDFQTQTGRIYQLHIHTADGEQYQSDSVLLRETPEIDSVFFRYEERVTTESVEKIPGLQIYVTTHDPDNDTWYYRWEFEETWEFRTKYNSTLIWDNGMLIEREEQINRCWKHNGSTGILVTTSKNLNKDIISEFPIVYVSNGTDRLNTKYSILVKQYALSEQSFNYWKDLEKINENLGTLFDPQPYQLTGNIYNVNDPNDIVLGYFEASSVQERRKFINRGEFPYFAVPDYYASCMDTVVGYFLIPEMILRGFMLVGQVPLGAGRPQYQLSSEFCIDCRIAGTNVKPNYWD